MDSYYHYDNGIVFHGALGHSLNSTLVLEAIKRARDKDTYIEVKPQAVDSAFRKFFLQRLTATAYVQMQRRDGEELSPFSARRALQQNHIDLITAILFETQSLVAWEKMPSNDGPYQASATLIAKDGTQLRKFIDQLRSGSLTTPPMTNERLISLAADFKLPDLVAPTATALLNNSSFSQSALSDVLRDTIENRGVSVAATVDLRSDTGPTLSASADVSRTELSAEEIAASMGGGQISGDKWSRPVKLTVLEETVTAVADMTVSDSQLIATLSQNEAPEFDKRLSRTSEPQVVTVPGTMFAVVGDFTPREIDGVSMRGFIEGLEKAYQRSIFWGLSEDYRRFRMAKTTALKKFRSLIANAPPEGDWKGSASIHARRGVITARCQVGQELYNFCRARDFVAKQSLFGD